MTCALGGVVEDAQSAAGDREPSAERSCAALVEAAPTGVAIATSEEVPAPGGGVAWCRVAGQISPSIGFEMRLPVEHWNGRFLVSGCGAFCGQVLADLPGYANSIDFAVRRGYAAITSDAGHQGSGPTDLSWAYNNPAAERLYAHAWVPRVAEAGRALLERFYGTRERFAYFSGCSNGGRTALKTAQLYPDLFDGIASGCPGVDAVSAAGVLGVWLDRTLFDREGQQLLSAEKIPLLAKAVLSRCDSLDGRVDGVLSEPQTCVFDPAVLECTHGTMDRDCLTPAEVQVVEKLYGGPRNSAGARLYPGLPYGSEPDWAVWLLEPPGGGRPHVADLGSNYLRYIGFPKDPGPGYSSFDFDLDRDLPKLEEQGRLLNATDPDLRRFRDAGGKLLMHHGLADGLTISHESSQYVDRVVAAFGGWREVDRFLRLFLIPSAGHCADSFDPLLVLERWVEAGVAPDSIEVRLHAKRRSTEEQRSKLETRTVCAYPKQLRHEGNAVSQRVQEFQCVDPISETPTLGKKLGGTRDRSE
jgi:feruloyl esterase